MKPKPHSFYWPLFKHMSDNHGLTLLDSECEDIYRVAVRMRNNGFSWERIFNVAENLAVIFRTNHPDIEHVDTLELMKLLGFGYIYGFYRAIPRRHTKLRRKKREEIAELLSEMAKQAKQ